MDKYEAMQLREITATNAQLRTDLKAAQQQAAVAMGLLAQANRALEETATDLEGRARSTRAIIKQVARVQPKPTAKKR